MTTELPARTIDRIELAQERETPRNAREILPIRQGPGSRDFRESCGKGNEVDSKMFDFVLEASSERLYCLWVLRIGPPRNQRAFPIHRYDRAYWK